MQRDDSYISNIYDKGALLLFRIFGRYKPALFLDELYPKERVVHIIKEKRKMGNLPEWAKTTYLMYEIMLDERLEKEAVEREARKLSVATENKISVPSMLVPTPEYVQHVVADNFATGNAVEKESDLIHA